jgi:hypothetical protein
MKIINRYTGVLIKEIDAANLSSADLSWANLSSADLRWANLRWANLSSANLSSADLSWANLSSADLSWANLRWANLSSADLSWANLSSADLSWANLSSADLRWADLPSPTMVLLASWGRVSPELCADLMMYDASCHPNRKAFDIWANGGPCPYSGVHVQRACNFREDKTLWGKGKFHTPYSLMMRLFKEKRIKF